MPQTRGLPRALSFIGTAQEGEGAAPFGQRRDGLAPRGGDALTYPAFFKSLRLRPRKMSMDQKPKFAARRLWFYPRATLFACLLNTNAPPGLRSAGAKLEVGAKLQLVVAKEGGGKNSPAP